MSNDNKISVDDLGFVSREVLSITDVPDEFTGTVRIIGLRGMRME